MTLLRLDFDQNIEEMDDNFKKYWEKKQKVAKNLQYEYLSIFGKICVEKTLMLAELTHIAVILHLLLGRKRKLRKLHQSQLMRKKL